ncbi:Uncharacterised protein [Legionella steigerwaltii]|uniref:Uncharacterized protein n=1 Tax=Legionella steigerwaltii TaxID=460 RepID=A0A378LDW4_9GAMM|nr:hypothetical protein [Legionella steigerwaltii]KTD77401.1 hypothetical protein Lstg_1758 [Legionella steigerwaltii]STY22281.1 Uncharacterised protein [Legionella steigerwaltii]
MQSKIDEEKKAAKERYEELLAALAVTNKAHPNLLFEIQPNKIFFEKMYDKGKVTPLHVDFVSKKSGAKFSVENKFYPDSWVIKIPENATKEEMNCIRDVTLEAIAHPTNAAPGYTPKLVAFFPDNTPEQEIIEFVKAAEEKGIGVNLFIGKREEFDKISEAHEKKTKEIIASGNLDKLPGWDGYMNKIQRSDGGKKGEEFLSKYHSEPTSALSNN